MNLVLTVLQIVAPVFLLALIGYVWVKSGHEYRLEFVTKLTMTLSVPALIFTALLKAEIDPSALASLFLATAITYGIITLVALVAVRGLKLNSPTYLAPLIFGNTGNLGLPLALFAFGETGLSYAVVVFAVMAIWSFTFGVYVTAGGGSPTKAFKEPLLWAAILGTIFLWQGWTLPRFALNTLELLGQVAIPMMLITLGVAVARLHPHGLKRATFIALGKAVACAAIAATVGYAIGLDAIPNAVLIVQATTPIAVTSYMLAAKYGADSDAVAALVVASTLLSVAYLPILLALVL
nr:AEC family transporter [uncultured Celeribacter sp.]